MATSKKRLPAHVEARRHSEYKNPTLEGAIAKQLTNLGVPVLYETMKISYVRAAHTYTPDFLLPNGIIVEAKGYFTSADRSKHLAVKKQHPELDIRFVFSRSNSKINKTSTTTYASWCNRHGFKYADKLIPQEWIDEPTTKKKHH